MISLRLESPRSLNWTACGIVLLATCGCGATSGVVYNNSGKGYYQRGNFAMARDEFNRAVIDDPQNPDYRHNLALAMLKTGDAAGAERVLRSNLTENSVMHQPTYHTLSRLLVEQNRHAEAQQMLQAWSQTQPYLPESHVEMAWINREMGNSTGAEQELRQALQVDPRNSSALAQLGQLYEDRGQTNQAASLYQRSLASRWGQPQVQSRLVTLANRTGSSQRMTRSALMQNQFYVQPTTFASAPQAGLAAQPIISSAPGSASGRDTIMAAAPVLSPTPDPAAPGQGTSFEQPIVAGSTLIPNADPAHAQPEMTAEMPSVDPF